MILFAMSFVLRLLASCWQKFLRIFGCGRLRIDRLSSVHLGLGLIAFGNLCLIQYALHTGSVPMGSTFSYSGGTPAVKQSSLSIHVENKQIRMDEQHSDILSRNGLDVQGSVAKGNGGFLGGGTRHFRYGCPDLGGIVLKRKLGHGVSKQVYLGVSGGAEKVAVKMVTRNLVDVTSCLKRMADMMTSQMLTDVDRWSIEKRKFQCYLLPNMKLMKEILLLNQLEHPNLLRLLGYCVRSEETESTSLLEHGVVAVYEYGQRFYTFSLSRWPFDVRLGTALELASLLDYLDRSPLGSMRISDFKEAHFLLTADRRIKLTDLDDMNSLEPECRGGGGGENYYSSSIPPQQGTGDAAAATSCGYGLRCLGGQCLGYNAKYNMDRMNRLFFRNLLVAPDYEESTDPDPFPASDGGGGGGGEPETKRIDRLNFVGDNRIFRRLKGNYAAQLSDLRRRLDSVELSAAELMDSIRRISDSIRQLHSLDHS